MCHIPHQSSSSWCLPESIHPPIHSAHHLLSIFLHQLYKSRGYWNGNPVLCRFGCQAIHQQKGLCPEATPVYPGTAPVFLKCPGKTPQNRGCTGMLQDIWGATGLSGCILCFWGLSRDSSGMSWVCLGEDWVHLEPVFRMQTGASNFG